MIYERIVYQVSMVRCPLKSYNRAFLNECQVCTFYKGEIIDNTVPANYVKCSYQKSIEEMVEVKTNGHRN